MRGSLGPTLFGPDAIEQQANNQGKPPPHGHRGLGLRLEGSEFRVQGPATDKNARVTTKNPR